MPLLSQAKRRLRHLIKPSSDPVRVFRAHPALMDEAWYLERYPDVAASGMPAARHYAYLGWKEGRDPNPYFDTRWYLDAYADVRGADVNPLHHYIEAGAREGRDPFNGFDGASYRERHPDFDPEKETALEHLLKSDGLTDGRNGDAGAFRATLEESGLFHEGWYRARYGDVPAGQEAIDHYLTVGTRQRRKPNPYFDPVFYLEKHPAVRRAGASPLPHYLREGWRDGLSPSREFSLDRYAALTGWSVESGIEPLAAFLGGGLAGIRPVDLERPERVVNLGSTEAAPLFKGSVLRYAVECEPALPAPRGAFVPNRLRLHWITPDFGIGGGGHMTIFRMVREFALRGHRQTVWLHGPGPHANDADAFDDLVKHYQTLDAEVRRLGEGEWPAGEGDAVIATDWASAWPARAMRGVKRGFYFVQDFEPLFHPRGSEALLAEATYSMDLDCICASPWLARTMQEKYGRWSRFFHLAADRDIYYPAPADKAPAPLPRIAFYARNHTPRRAIDLGLLALELLAARGHRFVVDLFGGDFSLESAGFAFVQHGIRAPKELAELYREATVGVVFSATNYSLVPQEMMACRLPVLELDVESTRAIYPEGVVTRARPEPVALADALEALLSDAGRRDRQSEAALEWVSGFSWKAAADTVERGIVERLSELGHAPRAPAVARRTPKMSVVIPTLDGGPLLLDVVEKLKRQELADPFEILVVDSGSTDGTVDKLDADPRVMVHRIAKKDFGHGRTRNLGVELTSGDYVAFLTQDAMPLDSQWLQNYALLLDHFPNAAGAFGPHLAWPDASPFVKRDMDAHFRGFLPWPLCVSRDLDRARYEAPDIGWRQMLHYYSDNNSCLRRSAWARVPYRDVKFGEDQLFAEDAIAAGWGKVFVPSAKVYHSHDYDAVETRKRAAEESEFFYAHFGYAMMEDEATLRDTLAAINASDLSWGRAHGVPAAEIEARMGLNEARLWGFLDGKARAGTRGILHVSPRAGVAA